MSDKEKPEINTASKSSPVLLLLFVGFIFGFIAGYASKDIILQSLSKFVKTDIEATQRELPMPGVSPSTTDGEPLTTETTPTEEEKKKEEEEKKEELKNPEGEKPAEKPAEKS